jgi:hypothetical protein
MEERSTQQLPEELQKQVASQEEFSMTHHSGQYNRPDWNPSISVITQW